MKQSTRRATWLLIVVLFGAVRALRAQPYITVVDDGIQFSPDPVSIVTGMAVYWTDDGSGPYTIYSQASAWSPFQTPGGILFDQAGTYSYFDDAGDQGTVYVSDNLPPAVSVTSPTNNAVFAAPASFMFVANASDTDADGMSDVEFFVGTNFVDDVFASTSGQTVYQTDVTNLPAGVYTLTADAFDAVGADTTTAISIVVQNSLITLRASAIAGDRLQLTATGLTPGKTNILQSSIDIVAPADWTSLGTNIAAADSESFTNAISGGHRFFRLLQLP